ncbi:MAG: hypothetical protein ACRDL5_01145 [Solirubrobacteraceae bacterium]
MRGTGIGRMRGPLLGGLLTPVASAPTAVVQGSSSGTPLGGPRAPAGTASLAHVSVGGRR